MFGDDVSASDLPSVEAPAIGDEAVPVSPDAVSSNVDNSIDSKELN